MQTPTVGRIVHFYPGTGDTLHLHYGGGHNNNGAEFLPAIVIQVFGNLCNLVVFTFNSDATVVRRYSVIPASTANLSIYPEGVQPTYWDWPQIAPVTVIPFTGGTFTDGASGDGPTFKQFNNENRA